MTDLQSWPYRRYYGKPTDELWSAYYLEPATYGLFVPRRQASEPYPERLIKHLADYTNGVLSRTDLAVRLTGDPDYLAGKFDPLWLSQPNEGEYKRKAPSAGTVRAVRGGPDELIPYRWHKMPDGSTERVLCPRRWLHGWLHTGFWPPMDNKTPFYTSAWARAQEDWKALGIRWHLPVLKGDIRMSAGFYGFAQIGPDRDNLAHVDPHTAAEVPWDLRRAANLVRHYLPDDPKKALPPALVVEYLIDQEDVPERIALLAVGYAVSSSRQNPRVALTPDGRIWARQRAPVVESGNERPEEQP